MDSYTYFGNVRERVSIYVFFCKNEFCLFKIYCYLLGSVLAVMFEEFVLNKVLSQLPFGIFIFINS